MYGTCKVPNKVARSVLAVTSHVLSEANSNAGMHVTFLVTLEVDGLPDMDMFTIQTSLV